MQTLDTRFEREARKAIEERVATLTEEIALGNCTSFEDYRNRCGVIAGLRSAADLFEDVNAKLKER